MNKLLDQHGRRFSYLRLSITDVCNFRCQYCLPNGYQKISALPRLEQTHFPISQPIHFSRNLPHPGQTADKIRDEFLSVGEIENLVRALAGLGMWKVRLTGGEPTTRKDLIEIAARISSIPGIRKVALTTNGYRLLEHAVAWREAGISALNVSIDSLDRKNFHAITGHDKLPEILAGIEKAQTLGFDAMKINTVLLKGSNDGEIDTFVDWIKDKPVSLRWIELMQTGDNLAYFNQRHLSSAIIVTKLLERGWSPVSREEGAGPAQEFSHPKSVGHIGIIAPYSKNFCDTCNRLRVTARGDLRLCLFGNAGHSLRHLLQTPDMQDVLQKTMVDLLTQKVATHDLHSGHTGITPHLASLGG